jgi:hypothetical protein
MFAVDPPKISADCDLCGLSEAGGEPTVMKMPIAHLHKDWVHEIRQKKPQKPFVLSPIS